MVYLCLKFDTLIILININRKSITRFIICNFHDIETIFLKNRWSPIL